MSSSFSDYKGPIRKRLSQFLSAQFQVLNLDPKFAEVFSSDRPDLGHYQCNGALAIGKILKRNPREVANDIVVQCTKSLESENNAFIFLSIAGPGFINFKLSNEFVARLAQDLSMDGRKGIESVSKKRKVVIDYGGPNVAKSMHAGHLRSSIIGDALKKIMRFAGDEVVGDNHLGDWGTPMGMIICQLKHEQPDLPYFDESKSDGFPYHSPVSMEDLERLYPVASKRFKEDADFEKAALRVTHLLQEKKPCYYALWNHFYQTTMKGMSENFSRLGIEFDVWLGESFYEDKMPPLVERLMQDGHTIVSEGALVIPLEETEPPLILVKSGGGFLYSTSDLATLEYRVEHFKADLILYVIDKRQSFHLKQVFKVGKLAGIMKDTECVHTAFGTMNGPDGKPFKTREGGILKLSDLIEMIVNKARERLKDVNLDQSLSAEECEKIAERVGIATLKYADLKNGRETDYIFDLERFSKFEGNTGPYLLYSVVRMKSMMKKALSQGVAFGPIMPAANDADLLLQLELLKLSDAFYKTYDRYEPHHLCEFGFNLSQVFNSFYASCHILNESDGSKRSSWLSLVKCVHDQMLLILGIIGIEVPERM